MNILVTGAGGYIGTTLTRLLLKNNHNVIALDRFHFGEDLLPEHENLKIVKGDIRNVPISILLISPESNRSLAFCLLIFSSAFASSN